MLAIIIVFQNHSLRGPKKKRSPLEWSLLGLVKRMNIMIMIINTYKSQDYFEVLSSQYLSDASTFNFIP